ncbi:MAG TPA: PBP1A family penicillin-binding protein [Longimicrobiales bacterium]
MGARMPGYARSLLRWLRAHPRFVSSAGLGLVVVFSLFAGLALGTWTSVCRDCPSIAQIYVWEPKQATRILSHDGQLIAELFQERRTPVSLADLPPHVPQAFIAVEDRRFYQHGGFSLRGIARAIIVRLPVVGGLFNRRAGGGSTITQQLARHMFPEQIGFERRPTRKLKELKVALELERAYTKDQILEAYINQVNYGHGWHGIESAAQHYFGKPATELNPAEAAMLAAVINRPTALSPFRNPEAARARRNLVLELMAQQGYLSKEEAERWKSEPLPTEPSGRDEGELAPYFVEWIRGLLDDRYGSDIYRRGLRVITTLDIGMQRAALAAMEAGWQRIESQPGYRHPKYAAVKAAGGVQGANETPYLQGLFIAMDVRTGEIRALIGGRDFDDSKFNRALQARRQPGSVFKPFVYTAAIASGIPASHVIFDAPVMLPQQDGTMWAPENYDREFRGPMTLREALRRSINIPAVQLGLEVGIETVAQYAQRMGIETPIPRFPSTAIGAADVIPIQIATAYGVFATQGVRVRPRAILRVEDGDGRVIWETQPDTARVLDPLVASVMLDLLRDVVDRGTAYGIRDPARGNLSYDVPAAGKTGTTNDATDVWFVGFTPDLLAAVWLGFDRPKTILPGADGGRYAAPVWADFMRAVYAGDAPLRPIPEPWTMPPELTTQTVDRESGKLATEWCPTEQVYREIYIPGTEPTEACDVHGPGIFGGRLRGILPDTATADTAAPRIDPPIRF